MSFILDALKKSETERQRQDAPGFASVPKANERKSSRKWIWLVVVLLGINLTALMGVLFMANRGGESPPAQTPIQVPATNSTQSASSFSEIVAEAKRTQPTRDSQNAETEIAEKKDAASTTVSESLATLNDLRAAGTLNLPDLHLDIHVYSGQSADRFVFINMVKYKESAKLGEGPVVKQITPEGVVLDYHGTDFLLPRE